MSAFELSDEQKEATFFPTVQARDGSRARRHLVIEAGAGAGKTRVLTERVHWLLCKAPRQYRLSAAQLILVTFSKAADEELRQRVDKELRSASIPKEEQQRILGRLQISTIDSLFMQIVNNIFPAWWEQTKEKLTPQQQRQWKLHEHRFPPALTLVSESELIPELSEEILHILERTADVSGHEKAILDFILAGAFQSQTIFSNTRHLNVRHRGLERLAAAMLHENFLRDDAPPLQFALERIHPSSLDVLEKMRTKAREMFHKRIMQGRMTHTDRMLFLYHLLCLGKSNARNDFFALGGMPASPLQCLELIVDEYQDTNELQHDILMTLVNPQVGRMVVVGDPKQSIYGFRSAHVGVFQRLKTDEQWHLVTLSRNYRSHPDLLPFINLLSDLTFSYKNNRIPEDFHSTAFAMSAQQTYVSAKSLEIGRSATDPQQASEKSTPRVLLLGASLNKQRTETDLVLENTTTNSFAAWALARELKGLAGADTTAPGARVPWSDVVVLCETNDQVSETQLNLNRYGIPAVAKLSRPVHDDTQRSARCEALGLLLAKWLCTPLDTREFAEFVWSGWLNLNRSEASALLQACRAGTLNREIVAPSSTVTTDEKMLVPETWHSWETHLLQCRSLARRHFFSAWQLLRWGFVESPQNLAMETVAVALLRASDVWSIRQRLERESAWPEEFIAGQLQQVRLEHAQGDVVHNAVTVCTIHGAKGLEWPLVVFWPHASRDRAPENFLMKNHHDATYIKWLAEDRESASLVPWIDNPTPPSDKVVIHTDGVRGEQMTRWSADLQDKLEQDFERQRVFYTAFTRAREMLIIMSPAQSARTRSNLRDKLAALKKGDTFDPVALKLSGLENNVIGLFADMAFDLRKEAKRGARPATPWTGLDTDAQCKTEDWNSFVRMADYSPAWIFVEPDIEALARLPSSTSSEHSALHDDWIAKWIAEQSDSARRTPWRTNTTAAEALETVTASAVVSSPEPNATTLAVSPARADAAAGMATATAEDGLRFHAYMEHADVSQIKKQDLIQRLLLASLVREHELELWSIQDVEQKPIHTRRMLYQTQRRIIDLFCVIEKKSFPKELWDSPCLRLDKRATGSHEKPSLHTLETSTVRSCLASGLKANPHVHLVIDFKTGAPSAEHVAQMETYLRWTAAILQSHPAQLVNDSSPPTLFAEPVRPLMGMIYYTRPQPGGQMHNFASRLISVDKNASVLFISPE